MQYLKILKPTFAALSVCSCSLFGYADNFDEVDLLGEWKVATVEGNGKPNNFWSSFGGFYLGETTVDIYGSGKLCAGVLYNGTDDNGEPVRYGSGKNEIRDFFISNNDKLHIATYCENNHMTGTDIVMRFIITRLTDEVLELQSYDGTYKAYLTKTKSPDNISEIVDDRDNETTVYDISGNSADMTTPGIKIVGDGTSFQKVVIR